PINAVLLLQRMFSRQPLEYDLNGTGRNLQSEFITKIILNDGIRNTFWPVLDQHMKNEWTQIIEIILPMVRMNLEHCQTRQSCGRHFVTPPILFMSSRTSRQKLALAARHRGAGRGCETAEHCLHTDRKSDQ